MIRVEVNYVASRLRRRQRDLAVSGLALRSIPLPRTDAERSTERQKISGRGAFIALTTPARTTNMRGMKAGFTKPALRLEIDMNRGIWVGSTRATALRLAAKTALLAFAAKGTARLFSKRTVRSFMSAHHRDTEVKQAGGLPPSSDAPAPVMSLVAIRAAEKVPNAP